ncbi:MAG: hypothetical protein IPO19_21090 [Rhodoferax sp.]|nr:hypothetical protein [Rhodoferax sp.]
MRFQVRQKSQGRQIPWESTSLEEDFFFNTRKVVAVAKPNERVREQAFAQEKADWDRISASKDADSFYDFLQKYPSGSISEVAQAQLERLQKAQTLAVANKDGIVQLPGAARYRLGDVHTMVVRDGYSGLERNLRTTTVTRIAQDSVEINDGSVVYTPEGGTIRNRDIADLNPPRLDLPAGDYAVGKKWSFRSIQTDFNGRKGWVEGDVRIVALEDVTVPAGTFKAYKVELTSMSQGGTRVVLTRWMEPNWGFAIKVQQEVRRRTGPADLEVHEMVDRQRGQG